MADLDEKIRDRIEKLLHLAAPSSGTTDAERASAAIEAARLIQEHAVTFRTEQPKPERGHKIMRNAWVLTKSLDRHGCAFCGKLISPNDIIWVRVLRVDHIEYRHNCVPCRIE